MVDWLRVEVTSDEQFEQVVLKLIDQYDGTVEPDPMVPAGSVNIGDTHGAVLNWIPAFSCAFWIDREQSGVLRDELLQSTQNLTNGEKPGISTRWSTGELKGTKSKIIDGAEIDPWVPEIDDLLENGIEVYVRSWDSGAPGAGAGDDRILYFDGSYWVWLDDSEPEGPYRSFYSAIVDQELHRASVATTAIDTVHVDDNLLKEMLEPLGPIRFSIQFNGELVTGG